MEGLIQVSVVAILSQCVVQCPVFLALIAGAVVGVAALARGNRLAGALACCGFAALAVLLAIQLVSGALLPFLLMEQQGMRPSEVSSLMGVVSCMLSTLKAAGLLAVVGALAAYALRGRRAGEVYT